MVSQLLPPPLFPHQVLGVKRLAASPMLVLGDEMRLGKTRQVIEAAQHLWSHGVVNTAIVVAPAPVRSVWADPEFGQVAEYCRVPLVLHEYRSNTRTWRRHEPGAEGQALRWIVTNYEFARQKERMSALLRACGPKTVLVLDEANAVKSPTSLQSKAMATLRRACGWVWLLTGTPEGDNPGDVYQPFAILDPNIIGARTWHAFKARYAVQRTGYGKGGHMFKEVVGWTNLEDLSRRTAPYILRRTMAQVYKDLPPVLEPQVITVPLEAPTWATYTRMRQEALVELSSGTCAALQAGVKALRLSQLCGGLLGGVTGEDGLPLAEVQVVSSEKLDAFLAWHQARLEEDKGFKVVVWCRFRAEVERLAAALGARGEVGMLYGDQRPDDRRDALRLLDTRTAPAGPAAVVGTARTGGLGLDLAAASTMVYFSNDHSLLVRRQADARLLGPRQVRPVQHVDLVATGPNGQHTLDHGVLDNLRHKRDLSSLTARDWVAILVEEGLE